MGKQTFALYFGNRGFFPASLIAGAREEMAKAVSDAGYNYLMTEEDLTRYGAVETAEEGRKYAAWLKSHRGEYDGVIICLPNFGDENGAIAALQDCGCPILVQAYPDEIGKMDFAHRRDSFCGKLSICDVFHQYDLPFTVFAPHVVHPLSKEFEQNLHDFAAVCRVVKGMKRFTVGMIGARLTPFKTVRYDELTFQKKGITVESFDLSELFAAINRISDEDERVAAKKAHLSAFTHCECVPAEKMNTLAKLSIAMDELIETYQLDCVAIRCWNEMEDILGVTPCVLLGEMNERCMVASCETDVCSAVSMYAMQLASEEPTACLDWNNNYGDDPNKVILFHCGSIPQSMMVDKGDVTDHKMHAKRCIGCGWGSNEGRIAAFPFTYANCKTENGVLEFFVDEGEFTADEIEPEFFGCGGVAQISDLQRKLLKMAREGYRHHVTVGKGNMAKILKEAFTTYLKYNMTEL